MVVQHVNIRLQLRGELCLGSPRDGTAVQESLQGKMGWGGRCGGSGGREWSEGGRLSVGLARGDDRQRVIEGEEHRSAEGHPRELCTWRGEEGWKGWKRLVGGRLNWRKIWRRATEMGQRAEIYELGELYRVQLTGRVVKIVESCENETKDTFLGMTKGFQSKLRNRRRTAPSSASKQNWKIKNSDAISTGLTGR